MTDPSAISADMQTQGYHFRLCGDGPPDMYQVLGERASGTNLIRKIIQRNARIFRTEGLGWKHGFPTMVAIPRDLLVVCAFRNAEDWAISMYKRPWHAHPNMQALGFSDFLRAPWLSIVDRPADFEMIHHEMKVEGMDLQFDRHPLTGERFGNLFALRRAKMEALLGMLNRDCHIALVKLEPFLADPEAFMTDFRAFYGLDPKREDFRMPSRRMGNNFNPSVENRDPAPERLSEDDRAFMLSQLNMPLETALGYSY
ncbi:hypothetical protein [Aestuariivita boseongensis]|uniref:hypothetical protein n=1 Tax=Aestuariivita boseongensis TaxID=1470562 RepID=UPI00068011EF|nr:hypothetical protein [Aestuariivita boseongensis]